MRRASVQQGRKADPPPLSGANDEVAADGAERDERPDAYIAVLADIEREAGLDAEDEDEKQDQPGGQERDIRDQTVLADRPFECRRAGPLIERGGWNDRGRIGSTQWARDLRGRSTPAKGLCRHHSSHNIGEATLGRMGLRPISGPAKRDADCVKW